MEDFLFITIYCSCHIATWSLVCGLVYLHYLCGEIIQSVRLFPEIKNIDQCDWSLS